MDQLEKASWFSRVGVEEGSRVAVLTSWPEAVEQCSSFEWEDLRLEALNQCRECIAERSKERLQLWNNTVDEGWESEMMVVGDQDSAGGLRRKSA